MAAIVDIDGFLEHTIGVTNVAMRGRIATAGYTTLDSLIKKEPGFAKSVCTVVRRSTGGGAATKDVSVPTDEYMGKLILLARYIYIVQRPIDFTLATLDNMDGIESWFKQLQKNQPIKEPAVFQDAVNKKSWFESIIAFLS